MLFNTPLFFFFFAIFFVLYSFVFLRRTPRLYLILVGSLIFYAGWNYRFIPLLVFSAVVDYFVAIGIHNSSVEQRRKLLLAVSIATNLGILAVFKYSDFALQSAGELLALFGFDVSVPVLGFLLPVGISFYTFQSMSYTIDVYRGVMQPRKGLLQFTAALAFFPQLVAGPILRAREILPQLEAMPKPSWDGAKHGFVLISVGLFKKTIADLLAGPVDAAFNSPDPVGFIEAWTGALAFAGQIYGDFSGYTDMAIGIGLLLGFRLPVNFRLPYFAGSPVDFWRRWHISLSTWLRDYLYVSLGGNRNHRFRNVMITMLLGGLWHGAAWTFLVWGAFHGLLIAAVHYLSVQPIFRAYAESRSRIVKFVNVLVTFYLVLIGWVIFRALSIDSAVGMLGAMHVPASIPVPTTAAIVVASLSAVALLTMHLLDALVIRFGTAIERRAWLLWPFVFVLQLLSFIVGKPDQAFIYFQF